MKCEPIVAASAALYFIVFVTMWWALARSWVRLPNPEKSNGGPEGRRA